MSTLQSSFSSPSSFLTSSQQLSPKKSVNLTIPQHRKSLTTTNSFSPNGGGLPKDIIIAPEQPTNDNNNDPSSQTYVDCNANGGPDIIIRRPTRRILPRPRPLTPSILNPSVSRLFGGGRSHFVPLVCQYPSYITPATYFVSFITKKYSRYNKDLSALINP